VCVSPGVVIPGPSVGGPRVGGPSTPRLGGPIPVARRPLVTGRDPGRARIYPRPRRERRGGCRDIPVSVDPGPVPDPERSVGGDRDHRGGPLYKEWAWSTRSVIGFPMPSTWGFLSDLDKRLKRLPLRSRESSGSPSLDNSHDVGGRGQAQRAPGRRRSKSRGPLRFAPATRPDRFPPTHMDVIGPLGTGGYGRARRKWLSISLRGRGILPPHRSGRAPRSRPPH
jgi:hypothetical protein